MVVLMTTDIEVRTTLSSINIMGYTAAGNSAGLTIDINDVKSI